MVTMIFNNGRFRCHASVVGHLHSIKEYTLDSAVILFPSRNIMLTSGECGSDAISASDYLGLRYFTSSLAPQ